MLYIDSNVFIYPLIYDTEVEEAGRSRQFLKRIASGEVMAYTSTLSWDELVWVVRKVDGVESSVRAGRLFLNFPHLRFLTVTKNTLLRAQEIMEKYGVKPRDSIHAASAFENGITTLVSYDTDFDKVEGLRRLEP
ncbi:MAG: type II toxin-antitoxin system VapC family toxin [Candidatus Korarchaeota archaeon]|nr:type II toxin-antitoxin system VapC family toxin [Candidatus Korarchaeota archaeon]